MPKNQQNRGPAERPLLERRTPLGISVALVILSVFFFFVPFAFRSARLSLNKKENDIKDWLPSDFVETAELEWFADHFVGESFVIATWPGCNEEDQRLKLLASKIHHESADYDPAEDIDDPELVADYRNAKEYGVRLGLLPASRDLDNWGGENEKWFATSDGRWYYIKPNGHLLRWEEKSNGPAGLIRSIKRALGTHELKGTFVAAFGKSTASGKGTAESDKANPFYNDPSLLCAPMFRTVETGVSMVNELAKEGGLLWPVDFTDQSLRPVVAKRRAMDRLTGSLFAPPVPSDFEWTPQAFRNAIPESRRDQLPEEFDALVTKSLADFVDLNLGGELMALRDAPTAVKSDAWYAVFDASGVKPPPRQTCLLVTLTDTAQDNLAYALGRGALGSPRGRLLQLAADSGVQPAPPPSMAPPPFNRAESEPAAGAPSLRLGGPPVDNIAIDEEGTITLVRLVGYSVLVGIVLSYLCFGSVKITIMVFVVGGAAAMLSMAFVNWTDGHVDAILMSMPSLVYVLGLSGAIHVVNYYRDEVRQSGRSGAAGRALKHALFPCSLAALTTAIGLGSLSTSNLTPISNFGIYSAIGVIATLAILFSYLPAALQVFVTESRSQTSEPSGPGEPDEESWLSEQWAATGRWICRHHVFVTASCLVVLLAASLGLTKIKTSVQLLKLFDEDARIIRDYEWLESNFGKLVPMELVLRVPPKLQSETLSESLDGQIADEASGDSNPVPLNILERVEAVARISHVVNETLGEPGLGIVGSTTAVNTFLKPLPGVTNSWNPIRSQYVSELAAGRDELLSNDYVRVERDGPYAGSELWRISLRVSALSDVDYGSFIKTLRVAVEPVIRAYDTRDQIVGLLAAQDTAKPTVVIVGSGRPKPLEETALLDKTISEDETQSTSAEQILTRPIFLATLDELLGGERIRQAIWLDLDAPEKPIEVGGELWAKIISRADVVVWADDAPAPEAALTDAKAVVDANAIFHAEIRHELIDSTVPQASGAEGMQVVYTGVVPVVYKAQRTLLGSLVESIALAFVLIAVVMVVLLNPAKSPLRFLRPRNVFAGSGAGVVSMVPNMFPVLLVFGLMGHFGRLVDIGTMMTASVAMGVAVDDTIHFLSWFRSYLDQGYDRIKAVELTYRRVGPAMTQTTIVGGLGLFVFALSTFTPTQRFGTLMLVLLAAALIGDLVLLPALLAGPLGRFFKPREGADLQVASTGESLSMVDADDDDDDEGPIDKDGLPHLKLHSPSRRADQPHRMKGR